MRSVAALSIIALAVLATACERSAPKPATSACTPSQSTVRGTATDKARYTEFCTSFQGEAITAGSDGAMWFTGEPTEPPWINKIGRITAAGAVKEYPIPAVDNTGIALGSDGAIWFTGLEHSGGQIGRITTSGVVTFFTVFPDSVDSPAVLTAGPDGAVWFVASGAYIGRITMAGVITKFYCSPCLGHTPDSIDFGPDGALWFTVYGQIYRMTTSGGFDNHPEAPLGSGFLTPTTWDASHHLVPSPHTPYRHSTGGLSHMASQPAQTALSGSRRAVERSGGLRLPVP